MNKSDTMVEIAKSLSVAQGQFRPILKTKTAKVRTKAGYEYTYNYADLADVIEATRDALAKNGLAVVQNIDKKESSLIIESLLVHQSGEWLQTAIEVPISDFGNSAVQSMGGTITYARRYAYSALLNIASEDDTDAKETDSPKKPETIKPEPRQPQKPAEQKQVKPEPKAEPKAEVQSEKPTDQELAYKDDRRLIFSQLVEIFGAKDNPFWTEQEKATINTMGMLKEADAKCDISILQRLHVLALIGRQLKKTESFGLIKDILDKPIKYLEDFLLDLVATAEATVTEAKAVEADQPEIF